MKRTVCDVVGTAAILEEEIGGLTVCDEVYRSAMMVTGVDDQRAVIECEKALMPNGKEQLKRIVNGKMQEKNLKRKQVR